MKSHHKAVQHTFKLVVSVLGSNFPLAALVNLVELHRGKPLRIEEDVMPVGMTGYCIALHDVDLVCTRSHLDEVLKRSAQLHEIAHLLLGHLPQLSYGETTPSYETFLKRRDLRQAVFRTHINAYLAPEEWSAETLGTLLLECIMREELSIPHIARSLHG